LHKEGEMSSETSRRGFLKTGAAAGAALATGALRLPGAHAAGSDEIRIGLIGCGGRGRGAVENAIAAADGVRLVAMGDAFQDRIDEARERFAQLGDAAAVPEDAAFVGFDAYEKVLASDANYVILATPPGFRPTHLRAAVEAGKNVFTEKPVAVDAPGIRACFETYELARQKGLGIGAGTQRRHEAGYLELMKRVADGAIGDVVAARCYWNQGSLWNKPRQESWSDLEWQMRNWLYFTWLSGDHIVEQHVHNIDVVNWAMGTHPVRAVGMGGRQSRIDPAYGQIFDHFAIDYEYENGTHLMSMCRQVDGCANRVAEDLQGTLGRAETQSSAESYRLTGPNAWRFREEQRNPYEQEHVDLIASIRGGKPYNELKTVTESTMTAIMGRMSAYTGAALTWDEALASEESLVPGKLAFGPFPVPEIPRPGKVS
jgi:myo-inositol 2-dehydrogenase/D-chiro-inositol 1-dehydrogenase